MGMNAHSYFAYGVILEGNHDWEKIQEAVGAETCEPNEDGVTHLNLGEWGGDAIVFNPSVASTYDGAKVVDLDKLVDFNHPAARVAIAKVLEKLGHKPVSPEWLLMAYFG